MTTGIIGGGLGGLILARVLQVNGMDAVVYEREASREARGQGGALDLHPPTGQRALRLAGLEAEFLAMARPEGQDMRLLDPTGTILLQQDVPDDVAMDRPEVDRTELRNTLLDALKPNTVVWAHEYQRATPLPEGGYRVHFKNGTYADHTLIVGADGARSRVRHLVTDARAHHAGSNYVMGTIPDPTPELSTRLGRGSYWALGDGQMLSAQRNGDDTYNVAFTFRSTEDWLTTIPLGDPNRTRTALKALYTDWAPELTALIDECVGTFEARPILTMPVGVTWPHTPGVTLIGDAAHLMPPVGEGANLAMLDAAELALALTTNSQEEAIKHYEATMFPRAAETGEECTRTYEMLLAPNAAEQVLAFFGG